MALRKSATSVRESRLQGSLFGEKNVKMIYGCNEGDTSQRS